MKRKGKKRYLGIAFLALCIGLSGIIPNPSVFANSMGDTQEEEDLADLNTSIKSDSENNNNDISTDSDINEGQDNTISSDSDINQDLDNQDGVSTDSDTDQSKESNEILANEANIMPIADMPKLTYLYEQYGTISKSYLAANGNPILITNGNSDYYNHVYYDNEPLGSLGSEDIKLDLTGLTDPISLNKIYGDLSRGFLFNTLVGGSINQPCNSNTHITVLNAMGLKSVIGGGLVQERATTDIKADVNGTTTVIVDIGDNNIGAIYGGGYAPGSLANMGKGSANVSQDTNVIIKSGTITDVYGGGYATSKKENQEVNVSSNTNIQMDGGTVTEIHGGGYSARNVNKADVGGKASILVNDGTITKAIYGGGKADTAYGANLPSTINKTNEVEIQINGGQFKNIIGGGESTAPLATDCQANIIKDVSIVVNDGIITGHIQGGGAVTERYDKLQANVLGNTFIQINGGTFTSEDSAINNMPTIIGGGSSILTFSSSSAGTSTVSGNTTIEVVGGNFSTPQPLQPMIVGGGAINVDTTETGSFAVRGNSSIKIKRGYFQAPILAGGEITDKKDTMVKGNTTIEILGGTFLSVGKGAVSVDNKYELIVSSGSVKTNDPYITQVKDAENNNLFLTTISLVDLKGNGPENKIITHLKLSDESYKTEDLYTDENGKLYLYLKEGIEITKATTIDGIEYSGSITSASTHVNGELKYDVHIPVTDIELINSALYSWKENDLLANVYPENAVFKDIRWEIIDGGKTGATIKDNKISFTSGGTIKVKATIEKGLDMNTPFVKEFEVSAKQADNPIQGKGLTYDSATNTFFANGNPIIIDQGSKGLNFYYDLEPIGQLDGADIWIDLNEFETITNQPKANINTGFSFITPPSVFAGGLDFPVDNATVSLLNGTINEIYAGGKVTSPNAQSQYSIKNQSIINLYSGDVNKVYGGGYTYKASNDYDDRYRYSNVKSSIINLRESDVKYIYGGGYGSSNSSQYFKVDTSTINIESGNHPDLNIIADNPSAISKNGVTKSNINISGGTFGGTINRASKQSSALTSIITITGGIMDGKITNTMTLSSASKLYISGGSVLGSITGYNINPYESLANSTTLVYKTELTVEGAKNLPITQINTNLVGRSYGVNDVQTDENGQLVIYLPVNTQVLSVESGKTAYKAEGNIIVKDNHTSNSGTLKKDEVYLQSIVQPEDVKGYAQGLSVEELVLPKETTIYTSTGAEVKAVIDWDLEDCSYDPNSTSYQQFDVTGTIRLPNEIINKDNLSLTITLQVTLLSRITNDSFGITVSGNINTENKEIIVNEVKPENSTYKWLLEGLGEDYKPIAAYEVKLIAKVRNSISGKDEYRITFPIDEIYNGREVKIRQVIDENTIKTVYATVENGSVTISTSYLTTFMIGVPLRKDFRVSTADEFRDAITQAGTEPTTIYLNQRFTVESAIEDSGTIVIPNGSDIVIIDKFKDNETPRLYLNRPIGCKPTIHIEKGGKLTFKSSGIKSLTIDLKGDTDINANTFENISNDGELVFENVNIDIYDTSRNTIKSTGSLTIKESDVSVVNSNNTWQNLWGAILLSGNDSVTDLSYSIFHNATYGSMIKAEDVFSLKVNNCEFKNNGNVYKMSGLDNYPDSPLYVSGAKVVSITGGIFENNNAMQGGALTLENVDEGLISSTTFSSNTADTRGGSIYFTGNTNVELRKITVEKSKLKGHKNSRDGGGGFFVDDNAKVVMNGGLITENSTTSMNYTDSYSGGGIMVVGSGQLEINDQAEISHNFASSGGGIHSFGDANNPKNLVINSAYIHHNIATTSEGGGIFTNNHTPLIINNVVIKNNQAGGEGGGLWTCDKGFISAYSLEGMAIYDNKAPHLSGADVHVSGPKFKKEILFSPKMLGNGDYNWMTYSDNWGVTELVKAEKEYYQKILNGYFDKVNLIASPTEEAKKAAESKAKVIIEYNSAAKGGGGIAINGPTTSGIPTKELTVEKKWNGDIDPTQPLGVEVQLYKDDVAYGDPVQLNANNNWQYNWFDLDINSTWTVKEIDSLTSLGYLEPTYQGHGSDHVIITNTYIKPQPPTPIDPETPIQPASSLSVIKKWTGDINENQPEYIEVQLYRDGKPYGKPVRLSDLNRWKYTWEDLSSRYTWSVDEINVPEGYIKSMEIIQGYTIITNAYEKELGDPVDPEKPQDQQNPEDMGNPEHSDELENPETGPVGKQLYLYVFLLVCSGLGLYFISKKY